MPQPIDSFQLKNGEILQIFPATEEDLPEIEELSEPIGFETGLETLRIYYRTSHEEWWIIRNSKGEMIAYANANLMPNGWIKGMNSVVRKDYQNLGVARHLPRVRGSPPYLGNLTSAALLRGSVDFHGTSHFYFKMMYYFGVIKDIKNVENPRNVEISKLNGAEDFHKLP